MTLIPKPQHGISELIDRYHERQKNQPRPHMGGSQLGHHCDRWLWLSFRWAVRDNVSGRVRRIFRRGQDEEAVVVSDLRAIGVDVQYTGADQARVDLGCHVSGSIDGIAVGVPGGGDKEHVLEIKTHNLRSFKEIAQKGVQAAKPMHWAQMQVYMAGRGLSRALYYAVCKDDDSIYTERVKLDEDAAAKLIERGHRLATSDRMPEPISTDPSWYQCRMCPAHDFCHNSHMTTEVNCRTCAHSTAMPDSTWHCAQWGDSIPTDFQREGCDSHVLHPDLVPWQMQPSDDEWRAVYIIDGKPVQNGQPGPDCYASSELVADPKECAGDDALVASLRDQMDARIEQCN